MKLQQLTNCFWIDVQIQTLDVFVRKPMERHRFNQLPDWDRCREHFACRRRACGRSCSWQNGTFCFQKRCFKKWPARFVAMFLSQNSWIADWKQRLSLASTRALMLSTRELISATNDLKTSAVSWCSATKIVFSISHIILQSMLYPYIHIFYLYM